MRHVCSLILILIHAINFAAVAKSSDINQKKKSVYIEGYIPNPQAPETGVRKVYLLIENGLIKKKSHSKFVVQDNVRKITEKQYGPMLLSSGFIDLHGHLKYHVIPLWKEAQGQFGNRFDWRAKTSYKQNVTSYLNNDALGSSSDPQSLYCQTYHYAEIKALVGGVTSVQGIGQDSTCTAGLFARNVEIQSDYNESTDIRVSSEMINPNSSNYLQNSILPEVIRNNQSIDAVFTEKLAIASETSTTVPSAFKSFMELRTHYLKYFSRIVPIGDIRGFIAHLSEGRRQDFYNKLEYKAARVAGLTQKGLIIIHGVGLDEQDFIHASQNEINFVWSPFSNLLLYGETFDVKKAIHYGLNVSLGSDWSPSGSKNLLDEAKIAKKYLSLKNEHISDRKIYEMMTINPAKALKLDHKLGRLDENYLGDIVAFKLKSFRSNPFTQIIESHPSDIQFVMVGGQMVVAKERLTHSSSNFDSLLSKDDLNKYSKCSVYKTTKIAHGLLSYSDLVENLKTVFPVLDTPTSCNDDYYTQSTQQIPLLIKNGQLSQQNDDQESQKFYPLNKQLQSLLSPNHRTND